MGGFLIDVGVAVVAVLLVAGLFAAAIGVGVLLLRRAWRRKRVALALQLNAAAIGAVAQSARWLWLRPVPDHRWRTLQRARRELLRAASAAEHAVYEAEEANASVGDLVGLSRRLRQATLDVDRSLKVAQRSNEAGPDAELLAHAHGLTETARGIQRSAAGALAELHRHTVGELTEHARVEERAMHRSR
jgi:hypothetical protein